MISFKFFQKSVRYVAPTNRNENPSYYSLSIYNHPESILDGPMEVLFYWLSDDNIRHTEYSLESYFGPVWDFYNVYLRRRESLTGNDYLPKIPRLHSIEHSNGETYDRWNHDFTNPNEIVMIHYKQYIRR